MGRRASDLASRLKTANDDVVATVESLSNEQWRGTTKEEGWTVAATAHHIGATYPVVLPLVQAITAGQAMPPISMDFINQGNAQHAKDFASCDRAEALSLLRDGCESTVSIIGTLSDEQLDLTAQLLQEGPVMTAEQIIEGILISHAQVHWASIKEAI